MTYTGAKPQNSCGYSKKGTDYSYLLYQKIELTDDFKLPASYGTVSEDEIRSRLAGYCDDSIDFKSSGKNTVGSKIKLALKPVKSNGKYDSKAMKFIFKHVAKTLRGMSLGEVEIRPIIAKEVVEWNKAAAKYRFYLTEGQISVDFKGDELKNVYAIVPPKFKFNDEKFMGINMKRVKINKKYYTYDPSTKIITFKDNAPVR